MVSFLRRRRALVCREAVALVTDYLEQALAPADRERFERHLRDCPHCSEYLAQIRATIRALGRVTPEDLGPDARRDLVGLYRSWRE